eukprot:RCo048693
MIEKAIALVFFGSTRFQNVGCSALCSVVFRCFSCAFHIPQLRVPLTNSCLICALPPPPPHLSFSLCAPLSLYRNHPTFLPLPGFCGVVSRTPDRSKFTVLSTFSSSPLLCRTLDSVHSAEFSFLHAYLIVGI